MNDTLLFLFPAINVVVTGLFTAVILRQYLQRRRNHQLYWSIALSMAFIATLAYIGMILAHPTSNVGIFLFRVYYAVGGTIMPSWLGLGSITLLSKKKVADISCIVLTILSILGIIMVFQAHIDLTKLQTIAGTPGTGILQPGLWLVMTIVLNSAGVVAVAGTALYSGWKLYRKQTAMGDQQTIHILWANVLIFSGAMLDALAGSMARILGVQDTFWLIMAVGWIVLFLGVRLTSMRARSVESLATVRQNNVTQA